MGTMNTCQPKKATLAACDEGFECMSGVCTANACI
jgi:hypothetical protein